MSSKKFAAAVNCMDGRTQFPVSEYLKHKYNVDYVDTITEPGPNKILAENRDAATVASIKKRLEISATKHGSKVVAIIGHHDCAGNPTEKKVQTQQIREAIKTVSSWGFDAEIIGLWVNEKWEVEEV